MYDSNKKSEKMYESVPHFSYMYAHLCYICVNVLLQLQFCYDYDVNTFQNIFLSMTFFLSFTVSLAIVY